MSVVGTIRIDKNIVHSREQEIKALKAILDKLELPHVIDDISFHNTSADLNRVKALHNTKLWKVEKDGSLSLSNRFGHNGRLAYRELIISSIIEFNFVNLCNLGVDEGEFLAELLSKFEKLEQTTNSKQIAVSSSGCET